MSSVFDFYAKVQMTVYGIVSTNDYGSPTYGVKGVVDCEYVQGGDTQTDSNGVEFVPSSTFFPVTTIAFEIVRGDQVALGDTSATINPDEVTTETVRKVQQSSIPWEPGTLDTIIYTG